MSLVTRKLLSSLFFIYHCHLFSIRDGTIQEMYAKFLIPGDLVYISIGDRIPADIRLFEVKENEKLFYCFM